MPDQEGSPPAPFLATAADLDAVTRMLDGECRGEPLEGQQAVAWVARNRASQPSWWGHDLCSVVYKPQQFSCFNDPQSADYRHCTELSPDSDEYKALYEVARSVMAGEVPDPTGAATHYEVLGTGASWAKNREFSVIIGRHAFYVIGPYG